MCEGQIIKTRQFSFGVPYTENWKDTFSTA